ncbi:hypothetical protein EHS13_25695 [Paenibacillus psychroresistens]|uniref:GNAT family N-acetyltransferase n=1 Tax=Paenibacillus psychroresistens TaxID=1778678 RepID=A0A6B8RR72_9BACL|nr:hypothetical protein [Paenibacillus psychroresistens]QGQ98045.1 hypothetical protein EHS13_25695 [Paenibacillus psychroresistens]
MSVIVKDCTMGDIEQVTSLMSELGYPTSIEEMEASFKNILPIQRMGFIAKSTGFVKNIV